MVRPCGCDSFIPGQPFVPGRDCRLCWNYHNDDRYRERWGGTPLVGSRRTCAHRGDETGRVLCPTCVGHVEVKTFACSVYGSCTAGKPLAGHACCAGCQSFTALAVPS